jgi:tyrosinase
VNQTLLFPLFAYQFEECFPDPVSVRRKAFSDRELEDFVRRGARVKLEFLDRAVLQEDMLLEIQRPLSKPLLLKGDSRSLLSKVTTSDRVLLTVGDMALPHGSDLYVRVFINKPDANESTPIDDPHYAGSFAFFNGHQASGKASAGTFLVDLTDAVGRLKNAGELMSEGVPEIRTVW